MQHEHPALYNQVVGRGSWNKFMRKQARWFEWWYGMLLCFVDGRWRMRRVSWSDCKLRDAEKQARKAEDAYFKWALKMFLRSLDPPLCKVLHVPALSSP